ncbi:MAG: HAMP domain-containing protein [Chloroflexi bacterium]|nr:HAMP domain-containing protein [Chloroflexota bacterium]
MLTRLRFRLVLSHLTVIVLAMGLSGVLLLSFFERYFLEATENSLFAQARITAQSLVPGAIADGPVIDVQTPLTNTIQQQTTSNIYLQSSRTTTTASDQDALGESGVQLGAQLTTRIHILDQAGIVLVDSLDELTGQDLSGIEPVKTALGGSSASTTIDGTMLVALPVSADGEAVAVVYLSQPLSDVVAVLQDLRGRWGLATAIGLLLSAVAGSILSQVIVNPLLRLTTAVEAVAEGNLDQKVVLNRRDELGRLSAAFNEMTDSLRAARQIQIDFVANVSHELRTPLTSVKTMTETLRNGAADDLEVRDAFLETVENEADRLIGLVNDLLLLSRADSRVLNLRPAKVGLAEFIQAQVRPWMARTETAIQAEVDADLTAAIDTDRIAQVMINVLDNAVTYSRPGGAITIRATGTDKNFVQVSVKDEGIGIAAAELPRIGQRFYRTDKARSRSQGGSGLGLAIASALVEAHGGRLWLDSTEGIGTTVHFTLPKA